MKKLIILLFTTVSIFTFAQNDTLQFKFDSIIQEANLLYSYEKVAWNSSDILVQKKKLIENYGGYVIYHSNDTLFVSFLDQKHTNRIAIYKFTFSELDEPFELDYKEVKLNEIEKELLDIKIKIVEQLADEKYEITVTNGYSPNLVLLKENESYKLYIIMGTSQNGVIPFGNDYLFSADKDGNIQEWRKFHSGIIPAEAVGPNGEKVISAIHSHLKSTPYITATDICTFRLYGELCGLQEFMVYSTAFGLYFKYDIKTNKIEISEL